MFEYRMDSSKNRYDKTVNLVAKNYRKKSITIKEDQHEKPNATKVIKYKNL